MEGKGEKEKEEDQKHIDVELGIQLFGDESIYKLMVQGYIDQNFKNREQLVILIEGYELRKTHRPYFRNAVHKVKGAVAYACFSRLQWIAKQLLNAIDSQDGENIEFYYKRLLEYLPDINQRASEYLENEDSNFVSCLLFDENGQNKMQEKDEIYKEYLELKKQPFSIYPQTKLRKINNHNAETVYEQGTKCQIF